MTYNDVTELRKSNKTKIKKNRLNRVMLPEKVFDTGRYKKMNKGQKLQN
jgi:hypothetical protein